ncbi:MAG TPA: alpha/beta hydrolase [Pseudonocardiaceae bacterium]
MRRVNRVAALLAAPAVLLAACAVGPSDRPAVAVRDAPLPPVPPSSAPPTAPLPPLTPSDPDVINFGDCPVSVRRELGAAATRELRYECATVTVELNPDEPRRRAGATEIGILRVGSGPVPLVVVGDVAGEPGSLLAARLANQVPPEFLTSFALVGVDRRGTGSSDPVTCVPGDVREELVSIDPGAEQPRGAERVLDAANLATRTCVQQIEEALSLIDSWRTAADLDEVRLALGSERLNAIAVGDGSRVLSAYLTRYGASAGRIVLDGAPDPNLDAIAVGPDLAAGAEHALDAFAADCGRTGCPLAPDPRAAIQAAAEVLRNRPLEANDGTLVSGGTVYGALLQGLADPARWPELAAALAAAASGDVDGLAAFVRPLVEPAGESIGSLPARLDAALLTTCNDTATRVPPDRVGSLADEWKARAPLFGPLFAQRLLVCSPAPVPTTTVPVPRQPGTPPILVIATDGDPHTPPAGTQRMAEALAGGILVNWQGNGHGAFPRTPCVTGAVQAFLIDGTLPRNGTTCPP